LGENPGMSDPKMAGDFLKGLSATEYSRISDLLDESIDMTAGDREIWLATLGRSDPKSAAVQRPMFYAQDRYEADKFLEDLPAVDWSDDIWAVAEFLRGLA
jgi:hypothetical protein